MKVIKDIDDLQKKLYKWRMDFFLEHFKALQGAADFASNWYTEDQGDDDAHGFDVIPYEISPNFDNLMKIRTQQKNWSILKVEIRCSVTKLRRDLGSLGKCCLMGGSEWESSSDKAGH